MPVIRNKVWNIRPMQLPVVSHHRCQLFIDNTMLDCIANQLGRGLQAEILHHAVFVEFNSLRGNAQN